MARTARREVLALLAEAKARPNDDTPRLILADYLEGSPCSVDQARGQFVRLQCELARTPPYDPGRPARQHRIRQLLDEAASAWLSPFFAVELADDWQWDRGLLRIASRKSRLFGRAAEDLLGSEALAWVEGIHLHGPREIVLPCLHNSLLEHVPRLSLRGSPLYFGGLRALAAQPALARFSSSMDLGRCHITAGTPGSLGGSRGEVALDTLLQSPHLGSLAQLDVSYNALSSQDIAALASTRKLPNLEHLDLGGQSFTNPEELIYLLENPALTRLSSLSWTGWMNSSRDAIQEAWRRLATCPALARLTRLDFRGIALADNAIQFLAASPHLTSLEFLDLSGRPPDHAYELAESPSLGLLQELRLEWDMVCPHDRRALRERFGFAVPPVVNAVDPLVSLP
jgi:uncharacterized protein (TIGR02996 family)